MLFSMEKATLDDADTSSPSSSKGEKSWYDEKGSSAGPFGCTRITCEGAFMSASATC
ncbi:hypothetical protein HOLleu_31090 [Holothuria leucospilota]|uniref:Uncharacterized protein n=1 Tax=Holothuria leucospilota TaxID=206669 RepID=A0A9Q1BLN2_HOLLE|nr:hypothetical protein HOLleu_31090 [Holothuria leucospilota]